MLVGTQLRRLREERGITRDDAGYVIRSSGSKISRLELGRVSFKERDIADLLSYYGVEDPVRREALLSLARDANIPGWWHTYDDVVPVWFQTYVGLEESASLIRTFEVQFVPGLLQTEDYARSVISAGQPELRAEEIERRVALRLARQRMLHRTPAPRLWAVIDEAALRRPIGGSKVMRAQIQHMLELMTLPNVTVQVMPFRFGGHAAECGAFSILRFPEPELPDVVYVEQPGGALYLDKREHVDRYGQIFNRLSIDSQLPELSAETLKKIISRT